MNFPKVQSLMSEKVIKSCIKKARDDRHLAQMALATMISPKPKSVRFFQAVFIPFQVEHRLKKFIRKTKRKIKNAHTSQKNDKSRDVKP